MNSKHAATCAALTAWVWIWIAASGLGSAGATPPASTSPVGGSPRAASVQAADGAALRIDAGSTTDYIDVDGNLWIADTGFVGGRARGRYTVPISGTPDDRIYQTERYAMSAYLLKVANGRYNVRLHFAEDNRLLGAPGRRVFDVQVEDRSLLNVDVFAEAGDLYKALVKSLEVTVSDQQLDILFTSKVDNPQIKGIEVIPLELAPSPTATRTPQPGATATPTATASLTASATPTSTPPATPTPTVRPPVGAPGARIHLPIVRYVPAAPAWPGCGDREDADDRPEGAAQLRLGKPCRGSLAGDGVNGDDWLYVQALTGTTLVVDLADMPAGADYDLFVFDAELADGEANPVVGSNAAEHVELPLRAFGRYYIRVVAYTLAPGSNTYSLRASLR